MRRLIVSIAAFLLTSCITDVFTEKSSYKPQRQPGQSIEEVEDEAGYKTVIAGDDRYHVEYTVKRRNDLRDAAIWGLYRCAEIAKEEGAPYLVFLRARIEGEGYQLVVSGDRPYLPEAKPETGVKGGRASFLFKIFKDQGSAAAFLSDPSVTHRVVYESQAILQRLQKFQAKPQP